MFLDPQPMRGKTGSPSAFLAAQMPTERPDDQRWKIKRKPLQERSQSQNNQQRQTNVKAHPGAGDELDDAFKSTIRLVTQSPPSTSHSYHQRKSASFSSSAYDADSDDHQTAAAIKLPKFDRASSRLSDTGDRASGAKPSLSGFPAASVSRSESWANEETNLSFPPGIAWRPSSSTHVVPKTAWHRRARSGSSGSYSNTSTLREADNSINILNHSQTRASGRLSQGTTLRGTPTPTELEIRLRLEANEKGGKQGPVQALRTLQEASRERPMIRAVSPSDPSSSSEDQLGRGPSGSSIALPPPDILRRPSRRRSSASSLPAVSSAERTKASADAPREQRSQDSFAQSEATYPVPSSPIVVIFDTENDTPRRSRSQSQPLRFTPSIESIQSRLHNPTIIPAEERGNLTAHSSWASLRPTSSNDTLPPLNLPRKRLRQRPASLSLGSGQNSRSNSRMVPEEYDTLARHQWSSHLSTIASESDRSRTTSQHLSHFSLGSGVLTGDDASSIPFRTTQNGRLRESSVVESVTSEPSPIEKVKYSSSEEEPGDMTLGIFREESAKPQPLFKPRSAGSSLSTKPKYDGPLPPIPPIPRSSHSDENWDTVSELPPQSPGLRPKRSGYSLRRRSNSSPSQGHSRHQSQVSYADSERWSHGSNIFPTWARHFYSGTAGLISPSKLSLASRPASKRQQRPQHARADSQWTERSITSRLGTGYEEVEDSNNSPISSAFLPSIFRPRNRARANTDGPTPRRSKRSHPSSSEESRPDSLAIVPNPIRAVPSSTNASETLPSGQPKWGVLKSPAPSPPRRLPRKYSKQKLWDTLEYPRPMTKDHSGEFGREPPHLAPNRRSATLNPRYASWRPPSFVESLDTLVRSRCNRQILLFCLGFVMPLAWMLGAVLPLPVRPAAVGEEGGDHGEKRAVGESEENLQAERGEMDAEQRWRDERQWAKARWWRMLNRVMSLVGVCVIAAVIAIAVVATT